MSDLNKGVHQAIRDTWIRNLPMPYMHGFFVGGFNSLTFFDDEITLKVPDTYETLWQKTVYSTRWALKHGYTHIFQCCTDTYVDARLLFSTQWRSVDYLGRYAGNQIPDILHGGYGYWLSPKSAKLIANTRILDSHYRIGEDNLVHATLTKAGIVPQTWEGSPTRHLATFFDKITPAKIIAAHKGVNERYAIDDDLKFYMENLTEAKTFGAHRGKHDASMR